MAGILCFFIVFSKILFDNIQLINSEIFPISDAAADIIAVHRANSDLLLIGHYTINGVNHFGPFFLYIRYLMELLTGSWLGSVFGAHLLATMLTNAVFFALLAALLTRLAGGGTRGMIAGLTATFVVLLQFAGREWPASTFMPFVVIAPFWAFLAAVVLLLHGSAFGLIAAAFIGLTLFHAYIPLASIASFLFLFCFTLGRRKRLRTINQDFPIFAYFSVFVLALIFAAPIILDIFLNPPGNIVKVFMIATNESKIPSPPLKSLIFFLMRTFLAIRLPLLIFIVLGAIIALCTRQHSVLIQRLAVVGFAVMVAAAVTYASVPGAVVEYQGVFLNGPLALSVAFGCMFCVLELWRVNPKFAVAAMIGSALFPILFCSFSSPNTRWLGPELEKFSQLIVSENPQINATKMVSIRGGKGIVAAIILDLEMKNIHVCHPVKKFEYYFTKKYICPAESRGTIPSYEIAPIPPCINPSAEEPTLDSGLSPLGLMMVKAIDSMLFQPFGLELLPFLRPLLPESIEMPADACSYVKPPQRTVLAKACGLPRGCHALLRDEDRP